MKLVRSLGLVMAVFVVAAGCVSPAESGRRADVPQNTATSPAGAAEQLRFTTKTVDGKDFSGESLAGKPAVLWFWAPWCPVCQREAPAVAKAAQANTGVTFVGSPPRTSYPPCRTSFPSSKWTGSPTSPTWTPQSS